MFNRKLRDIINSTRQGETTSEFLLDEIAVSELDRDELDGLEQLMEVLR